MRGINLKFFMKNNNEQSPESDTSEPKSPFRLFHESKKVPSEVIEKGPSNPFEEEVFRILKKESFDFSTIEKYCEFEDSKGEKRYKSLIGENTLDYIDKDGTFDEIKFKENIKLFMFKSFLVWQEGKNIEKLNISVTRQDVSIANLDKIPKTDLSLCGKTTVNINRDGAQYLNLKNNEIPKVEIFALEEFVGKPYLEVIKHIIKTYGEEYRMTDLEDLQYLLSFSEGKIPLEMREEANYNCIGSMVYNIDGSLNTSSVHSFGELLLPSLKDVNINWEEEDRVILIKK